MHETTNPRDRSVWRPAVRALLLTLVLPAAASAAQAGEETGRSYTYGNLSLVEGDVWHQRADDFGAHEAERGSTFLPGDRIWTREPGQAELRFAGRVTAWMDQGTKLDYVEGDAPHRLGFWTGSLIVWMGGDTDVVVETPGGTFSPQGEGEYRTDLLEDGRTVQFVVYSGIATVSTEVGSVLVGAGQRTVASEGTAPAPPEEYLGHDEFLAWTEGRQRRFVRTADAPYDELPAEVQEHAHDLDGHGHWREDAHLGWVWHPVVAAGWAPYRLGRWAHTPFGLTWVSYDPWGWAPYHYGRWGHGPLGWYWLPGSVWGPAWVSWGYGYDWVGWSPLGYYGSPVYGFYGYNRDFWGAGTRGGIQRGTIRGKAVPRGSTATQRGWSFTNREAVGRPASRNRLAASSVRNPEKARLLANGAVLDRGFRQRAVGVTAMTRSAKATTRRLSNSASGAKRGVATNRATPRAQRVGAPASAARARSNRATLAREAAGRERSATAAEAGRSRAVSRSRAAAGAAAAARRGTGTEAASRRGRATASGRTSGRAGTGARPVTSPRPRAGRAGEAGARRPSSVRPASPRTGAAAAGRSGAARSRPSGASRSRPSGASRSRPSGASRSRPSGASRSRPSGIQRGAPSVGTRGRPSGASRSRPSGASRSRPSGASRSRPSGASRSRPSGASRSRPSGASRSRPSGASRSRPSGASRSQPSGASRSRPSAASRSRPSGASRSRPSAGSRSRPSAASRSRPSAGSRSRPSAAASPRGGVSRSRGGNSSASRGGGSRGGGGNSAVGGGGSSRGGGGGSAVRGGGGGGSRGGSSAVSRGSSGGSRRPNNNH